MLRNMPIISFVELIWLLDQNQVPAKANQSWQLNRLDSNYFKIVYKMYITLFKLLLSRIKPDGPLHGFELCSDYQNIFFFFLTKRFYLKIVKVSFSITPHHLLLCLTGELLLQHSTQYYLAVDCWLVDVDDKTRFKEGILYKQHLH